MAQIAICGETFSENLGDGVIADSLTWLLKESGASVSVSLVDFSGRTGFGTDEIARSAKPNWIRAVHRSLAQISLYRKVVVLPLWYCSKRNRLQKLWREKLSGCDLILIGGGQLLMDNDLGFPLRIRELVRIARDLDKGVAFYACGVGKKWSRIGFQLLAEALLDEGVLWVSVRDHGSRDTLQALFPGANFKCNLTVDPAVCAAEAYGMKVKPESNVIGLGISAPNVLRRHTADIKDVFSAERVMQFWLELTDLLASDHWQYKFFTNGQRDDYAFAKSVIARISNKKTMREVSLLEKARDPRTLVAQVAKCRAIVAHRLHANIIAYSLGIPSVGLIWDKKVKEFGKVTGRSWFYLDPNHMNPIIVKQRLYEAMSVGVDALRLSEHKTSALKNVQAMLSSTGITP